jgi:hypothetical protein
MSAAFNRIHPAGCPANQDTLPTHQAGNDGRAIPAPAAVRPHSVRLRRRRRTIPESSRGCGLRLRVWASTVVGAFALRALVPLALLQ